MCTWIFLGDSGHSNNWIVSKLFLLSFPSSKVMAEVLAKTEKWQIALLLSNGTWFYLYLHQHKSALMTRDTNCLRRLFCLPKQRKAHNVQNSYGLQNQWLSRIFVSFSKLDFWDFFRWLFSFYGNSMESPRSFSHSCSNFPSFSPSKVKSLVLVLKVVRHFR